MITERTRRRPTAAIMQILHPHPRPTMARLLLFASVTNSKLQIWNLSWSVYPTELYLKFQWENKAKEDYKPEEKVADLQWLKDCITFRKCTVSYLLALEKRIVVTKKKIWLKENKIGFCLKVVTHPSTRPTGLNFRAGLSHVAVLG